MHDNPEGYRLSRKDLPPLRSESADRAIRFARGEELMDCVADGDDASVEQLLKDGADVNFRDGDGMTPLHRCGKEAVIALCLCWAVGAAGRGACVRGRGGQNF